MYSIKAIASLTGLGTETLRAWERRYQTIVPERDENGRRFYSQQDLEKLTLLANLTRQGHTISKLSDLKLAQLQSLSDRADEKRESRHEFAEQIVEALLDYKIELCEQMLKRALIASQPLPYLRDILSPALHYVGDLWHAEKLSVAQEHMFSACVKRILLGMVNNLQGYSSNRPGIMFATPCGEPHEFGILMCCLLAAEQQYNCYYLGADIPTPDLLTAANKLKTEIIVLSMVKYPLDAATKASLDELLEGIDQDKVEIWLGGRGAEYWHMEQENTPKNCEIITDLDNFHTRAQQRRFASRN